MTSPGARRAAARPWLGGWHMLIPIVALAASRDLWAPDEPRYAQIAREAAETGNWLVLHLCGDLYPDKPPLVYWLIALAGWLGDWSAFALRIPSILATLGSAWLAARIARRYWGEVAAAWTPLFYLGTGMVVWFGGRLQLDPLLAFFCLAAVDLAWDERGSSAERGRRLLLAGACAGAAALCKGPVAWLHVGLAIAVASYLPRAKAAAARRPIAARIGAVALAVLPVAGWAVAASLREPALWEPLFFGQHLGRAASADAPHSGPPWEHLLQMPALLLPWTGLVLLGCLEVRRAWRSADRSDPRAVGLVRAGAWLLAVLVVFSVIPPKRELYLLPIYPAAAWLAALAFERALRDGRLPRWVTLPPTVLLLLGGIAVLVVPPLVPDVRPYTGTAWPTGAVLIVASAAALAFLRRGDLARWANALSVGLSAAGLAAAIGVVPGIDAIKSAREMAEVIAARPEKPDRIPCIGVQPEGYRFYGGVPTVRSNACELLVEVAPEGADHLSLVAQRDWEHASPEIRAHFVILDSRRVGSRSVLLLGRAPASRL